MISCSDRVGAGGGTRTRTGVIPADFKSAAATVTPLPQYSNFFLFHFSETMVPPGGIEPPTY